MRTNGEEEAGRHGWSWKSRGAEGGSYPVGDFAVGEESCGQSSVHYSHEAAATSVVWGRNRGDDRVRVTAFVHVDGRTWAILESVESPRQRTSSRPRGGHSAIPGRTDE